MSKHFVSMVACLVSVIGPLPALAEGDQMAPVDHAMVAGMDRMKQQMSAAPMTGEPDRDFVAMMLPHHQGAVDMARVELQYGHDRGLRRLAHEIVVSQDKEIVVMHRWQKAHPGP